MAKYGNQVNTVALQWLVKDQPHRSLATWNSLSDFSNVLLQRYYQWTADDQLCSWIETPGAIRAKYDVIFNFTCERNARLAATQVRSLTPLVLSLKPLTRVPQHAFELHVHHDAVVTGQSDVISGRMKLVLKGCREDTSSNPPSSDDAPIYDELYVISQYWGTSVFHRMAEVVPRVAMCIDFLRRHPEILIHAQETAGGRLGELLVAFGIDQSRLVKGVVRAKVVYQPRSTPCGTPNIQESQIAAYHYHHYISNRLRPERRDRLLLIRRTIERKFTEHDAIESVLKQIAYEYNLTYTLFPDNPVPSLNETMRMFYSAVLVVGPHGAGLANIYFSQPGTYVVEGVCNVPHVNLCFQRLAHVLGHRWHGLTSTGGCESVVSVSAQRIAAAVRTYVDAWKFESER